jgi:2,4-dienoyl-CoA reductase-like NADH-dependent reductase (Old Yellow Enzyme family)
MCDAEGKPDQAITDLYATLARGGAGLIVTGDAYVTRAGQINPHQLGIHSDALVDELKLVADAVHREGGRIAVQINHAGRLALKQLQGGVYPAAPSPVPAAAGQTPPRELSSSEITDIIQAYGQAARRAKQAGFDSVQLHGAHGTSLISQFLSPHTNRRSDRWGGDFDRRLNFLRSVCEAARSAVGTEYPLWIKLASQDFVKGGLTPEDGARVAERLRDFGLDAIEISGGIQETGFSRNVRMGIRSTADEGYFLANARQVRSVTDLPIILVGGFRTLSVMERMVLDEGMDFVSLCRPLINDPELPRKMQSGETHRATCISCNLCLERSDEPLRCFYRYPK